MCVCVCVCVCVCEMYCGHFFPWSLGGSFMVQRMAITFPMGVFYGFIIIAIVVGALEHRGSDSHSLDHK